MPACVWHQTEIVCIRIRGFVVYAIKLIGTNTFCSAFEFPLRWSPQDRWLLKLVCRLINLQEHITLFIHLFIEYNCAYYSIAPLFFVLSPEIHDFSLFPSGSIFAHHALRKKKKSDNLLANYASVRGKGSRSWEWVQRTSPGHEQRLTSTKSIRSAVKEQLRKWRNNVWVWTNAHTLSWIRVWDCNAVTAVFLDPETHREKNVSHNSVYDSAGYAPTVTALYVD